MQLYYPNCSPRQCIIILVIIVIRNWRALVFRTLVVCYRLLSSLALHESWQALKLMIVARAIDYCSAVSSVATSSERCLNKGKLSGHLSGLNPKTNFKACPKVRCNRLRDVHLVQLERFWICNVFFFPNYAQNFRTHSNSSVEHSMMPLRWQRYAMMPKFCFIWLEKWGIRGAAANGISFIKSMCTARGW